MKKAFVNQANTEFRPDGTYGNVIKKIAEDGVCPFCPEHLAKYHKNPIEEKGHWLVTDNMYPYKPAKSHQLFIHKAHITHISEFSEEAWVELLRIAKREAEERNIVGGTLMIRFGDTHFTGASVNHLHANLVQSDPSDPNYDPKRGLVVRIG